MNTIEEKEKGKEVINQLIGKLLHAGFPVVAKSEKGLDIDLVALADALDNCTIERTGETKIVREPGKDGETDFIMHGTTAWITVSNPEDPTETGIVRIEVDNKSITTEIWPRRDETKLEITHCYCFWGDFKPEQETA